MKRTAAFTAALLVGALGARPVLSQSIPEPTRVGYLNVKRVFEEYWKRENIEQNLRARTDALEARVKQGKQRLEELGEALNTLNQETEEYRSRQREIEMLRFQVKLDQEDEMRRIQREARRQEALLYKDVVREAQAFGESRGYAAIQIYAELPPGFENEADLDLVVATRTVLWRDERLDVTGQVLEFLNAGRPR